MRHHAFAAAMGLFIAALFAPSSQSQAATMVPSGYWMKPDAERESKIQVFKCGAGKTQLCAKIAWLKEPNDSRGQPLHDIRNENPSLRGRSIVGLTIFTGLAPSAPGTWTGKIYNPEDGHTYSATLTVLSRKEIKLRGCKAWLLCGEKQWLRTAAPEEVTPPAPTEGGEQIEASADPAAPRFAPSTANAATAIQPAAVITEAAAAEAPAAAPVPRSTVQAMAEPEVSNEPPSTEALPKTAPMPREIAVPAAPPAEYTARQGYGFLQVSAEVGSTARLKGEDVSSMIVMSEPVAAPESAAKTSSPSVVQEAEPVPLPAQKPKPKPIMASAAAKPTPKPTPQAKPAGQPIPQEAAERTDTDVPGAQTAQSAQADPAMTDTPLTRRQKRLLRRQQQQVDPFLPWLR